MKWIRVWAIARKEFTHIIRDPRSLGMAIAIPMLLLVLFGSALTLDVDNVPLAIWDQSQSPASRALVSQFAASRYFSIRAQVRNYPQIERAIDVRAALMALIIPTDFARRIASGREAPVQAIVDGSDSNTATVAIGYAETVVRGYSQAVALREMQRTAGGSVSGGIDFEPRVWFNADMQSKNYIIPGLIVLYNAR